MSNKPNVLLVIMDCVRADSTSLHSYERNTTPFLNEFKDHATVFEHAKAPAAKSLTSHVSMFTGLHVDEHGVISRNHKLERGNSIWEWLQKEYNYSTGAFSGNVFLTELDVGLKNCFTTTYTGFNIPFDSGLDPSEYADGRSLKYLEYLIDSFRDHSPCRSLVNALSRLKVDRRGEHYVDEFLSWKDSTSGPWAGVLNLMDAHTPYDPPEESDNWSDGKPKSAMEDIDDMVWEFQCGHRPLSELNQLKDLYDGCIHYIDQQLRKIVSNLKETGELDNTLLIVTSDHGEAFGEQSPLRPDTTLVGHGYSKIHEALLHVPLVVKSPRQNRSNRIEKPVSLTYLASLIRSQIEASDGGMDQFVNRGPVLSTAVGLQDIGDAVKSAKKYCSNIETYTGHSRALYETEDDSIYKYMTWASNGATVELGNSEPTDDRLGEDPHKKVDGILDDITAQAVQTPGDDSVNDDIKQRLENLGYA